MHTREKRKLHELNTEKTQKVLRRNAYLMILALLGAIVSLLLSRQCSDPEKSVNTSEKSKELQTIFVQHFADTAVNVTERALDDLVELEINLITMTQRRNLDEDFVYIESMTGKIYTNVTLNAVVRIYGRVAGNPDEEKLIFLGAHQFDWIKKSE